MSVSSKCSGCEVLEPRRVHLERRVIDEHVQPAKFLNSLGDRLIAELLVRDIAGDENAFSPFGFDLFFRYLRVVMFIEVCDGDIRAFPGKQNGHGPADAGITAGNERNLVLQFPGPQVKRCVVQGRRIKPCLASRLALMLPRKRWGRVGAGTRLHGLSLLQVWDDSCQPLPPVPGFFADGAVRWLPSSKQFLLSASNPPSQH